MKAIKLRHFAALSMAAAAMIMSGCMGPSETERAYPFTESLENLKSESKNELSSAALRADAIERNPKDEKLVPIKRWEYGPDRYSPGTVGIVLFDYDSQCEIYARWNVAPKSLSELKVEQLADKLINVRSNSDQCVRKMTIQAVLDARAARAAAPKP